MRTFAEGMEKGMKKVSFGEIFETVLRRSTDPRLHAGDRPKKSLTSTTEKQITIQ